MYFPLKITQHLSILKRVPVNVLFLLVLTAAQSRQTRWTILSEKFSADHSSQRKQNTVYDT